MLKISKIHGEGNPEKRSQSLHDSIHPFMKASGPPFATSVQVSHKKVSLLAALFSMTVVSHYVHYKLDLTRVLSIKCAPPHNEEYLNFLVAMDDLATSAHSAQYPKIFQ